MLRGIAAISVVIYHYRPFIAPVATPSGYLAVDLFFMMSGVVLANAYDSRFRAGMTALEFMRIRCVRLYPLYLLGTSIGLTITLASWLRHSQGAWTASSIAAAAAFALFFLPDFFRDPGSALFPLNGPCWSLFFEMFVNAIFGVLWQKLSPRRLRAVALVSGLALVALIVSFGSVDVGFTAETFLAGAVRTAFGFSVGVLIARRLGGADRRASGVGWLLIAAIVIASICGRPTGAQRIVWDAVCVVVVFPVVVYWATRVDPPRWLRSTSTFLGLTSYAIYVLHGPLAHVPYWLSRHPWGTRALYAAPYLGITALALLVAGSWLVDRYLDTPVRRRLSRRPPKTAPVQTVT